MNFSRLFRCWHVELPRPLDSMGGASVCLSVARRVVGLLWLLSRLIRHWLCGADRPTWGAAEYCYQCVCVSVARRVVGLLWFLSCLIPRSLCWAARPTWRHMVLWQLCLRQTTALWRHRLGQTRPLQVTYLHMGIFCYLVGAFLQATSRVPRWWIGERPPDMAASCDIYK